MANGLGTGRVALGADSVNGGRQPHGFASTAHCRTRRLLNQRQAIADHVFAENIQAAEMPVPAVGTQFKPVSTKPVQPAIAAATDAQALQGDCVVQQLYLGAPAQRVPKRSGVLARTQRGLPQVRSQQQQDQR